MNRSKVMSLLTFSGFWGHFHRLEVLTRFQNGASVHQLKAQIKYHSAITCEMTRIPLKDILSGTFVLVRDIRQFGLSTRIHFCGQYATQVANHHIRLAYIDILMTSFYFRHNALLVMTSLTNQTSLMAIQYNFR